MSAFELSCVDLFAGAGGFSLGARNAGVTVRLAIENDKHAAATYRKNLCQSKGAPVFLEQDITSIDPGRLSSETFPVGTECDLMIGGPPCQGFSTHRLRDSGAGDVRNALVNTYFDFVRAFQPSAFLMENVPGMLWPRHQEYVDGIYNGAAREDYHVFQPVVIDARDFGVPQRRKRVFILGVKRSAGMEDLIWPPKQTHGSVAARSEDPSLLPWVNCAHAFKRAKKSDPNNIHMNHNSELIEVFRRTPSNGGSRRDSGRVLPCHEGHDGHKDVYGRIDSRAPAPTMTTACVNPSKGRFVHPTQHHGLTVRQAARIQTFPDTYEFEGGLTAAAKQIGNAVPPLLSEILIRHVALEMKNASSRSVKPTRKAA